MRINPFRKYKKLSCYPSPTTRFTTTSTVSIRTYDKRRWCLTRAPAQLYLEVCSYTGTEGAISPPPNIRVKKANDRALGIECQVSLAVLVGATVVIVTFICVRLTAGWRVVGYRVNRPTRVRFTRQIPRNRSQNWEGVPHTSFGLRQTDKLPADHGVPSEKNTKERLLGVMSQWFSKFCCNQTPRLEYMR